MKNITKISFLVAAIMVLNACSSSDGAPRRNINYSNIPDAIPKVEKINKRVNPSSYVVRGKRYYVLSTAKGYDKIGTASWYGTKFHGKLTSTGETYDMTSMSAANKELPIPCYAEVTNLKNNRKVIVKVNDRGPFVSNRIIDLSYAAAQKLGVVATGTAKVRVKAIDPKSPQTKEQHQQIHVATKKTIKTAKNKTPSLYLQVSNIQDAGSAKELQKTILENSLFLSKIENNTKDNKTFYKVKIGPFSDFKTANGAKELILKKNLAKEITFSS
ncbi:MAG: septal ring lytic transglycosylase RlpA family protein [Legionellales bacterium]|jgi:rare lipoprotein A|nr:septal ring lytic transglycosylase RlpA family protein [Legionellales bacterium]